jgi:hypothetical protein
MDLARIKLEDLAGPEDILAELSSSPAGSGVTLDKQTQIREERIALAAPYNRQSTYLSREACYYGLTNPHNTFYLDSGHLGIQMLLRGRYRISSQNEREYFFWVCSSTSIGAMGESWLRAEHGEAWTSSMSTYGVPPTWQFGNVTMDWKRCVHKMEFKDGDTFWIRDIPNDYVRLEPLALGGDAGNVEGEGGGVEGVDEGGFESVAVNGGDINMLNANGGEFRPKDADEGEIEVEDVNEAEDEAEDIEIDSSSSLVARFMLGVGLMLGVGFMHGVWYMFTATI